MRSEFSVAQPKRPPSFEPCIRPFFSGLSNFYLDRLLWAFWPPVLSPLDCLLSSHKTIQFIFFDFRTVHFKSFGMPCFIDFDRSVSRQWTVHFNTRPSTLDMIQFSCPSLVLNISNVSVLAHSSDRFWSIITPIFVFQTGHYFYFRTVHFLDRPLS